jgi:sugar phosphate isomerase/epimerase
MIEWPIALSTGCFYRRALVDVLDPIREAGFRRIEVCSFPSHLNYRSDHDVRVAADRIHALGIEPLSFHAPFADTIDITSLDEQSREASVQELLRACEAAAWLKCRHVVLHPGPEREGRIQEAEFVHLMKNAARSLNRVADRCCELGIELLLENMLAHLLFGHVRDMMYLLGEIGACEVGTCLDTGHAHLAGEMDIVIQKLSGHLKMVHVNDNRGDWDAHLPPGDGTIDWPRVVRELRRRGFRGALVLELSGGADETVDAVLARATRARAFLEHVGDATAA